MSMPGIPDGHLARYHWMGGRGRGAIGYTHRSSEISVSRECSAGVSVHAIDAESLIELREALRSRGILPPVAASHQVPLS